MKTVSQIRQTNRSSPVRPLLAGTLLAAAVAALVAAPVRADLIGYWDMDNNVNDSSGYNNNGAIQGSVPYVAGQFGSATSFNGTSANYVDVAQSASLDASFTAYTGSIWFSTPTPPGTHMFPLSKVGTSPASGYGVNVNGAWFTGTANYGSYGTTIGIYTAGQWNNVVYVYDPVHSTEATYLNGVFQNNMGAPASGTGAMVNNVNDLLFGKNTADNYFYNGRLDDVALFNVALTLGEVKSIYNVGTSALDYSMADLNKLFTLYANGGGDTYTSDGQRWVFVASGLSGSPGELSSTDGLPSIIFSDLGGAGVEAIPEPGIVALLGIGAALLWWRRRNQHAA